MSDILYFILSALGGAGKVENVGGGLVALCLGVLDLAQHQPLIGSGVQAK